MKLHAGIGLAQPVGNRPSDQMAVQFNDFACDAASQPIREINCTSNPLSFPNVSEILCKQRTKEPHMHK